MTDKDILEQHRKQEEYIRQRLALWGGRGEEDDKPEQKPEHLTTSYCLLIITLTTALAALAVAAVITVIMGVLP